MVAASLVTHWFAKKRGFVLGIIASGQAVGTLILVPATIFLVEAHGWRYAVLLLGQIVTFGLTPLLALFIRSKPADINLAPYGDGETPAGAGVQKEKVPISLGVIFRNRVFWLLSISYFICGFTDIGFTGTHFIPFAEGRLYTVRLPLFLPCYRQVASWEPLGPVTWLTRLIGGNYFACSMVLGV